MTDDHETPEPTMLAKRLIPGPESYPKRLTYLYLTPNPDGSWTCISRFRGSLHDYTYTGPDIADVLTQALGPG